MPRPTVLLAVLLAALPGTASHEDARPHWGWTGEQAEDLFAFTVAGAGDMNADGFDDIAVGLPGTHGEQGMVVLYDGQKGTELRRWEGEAPGDRFGASVAPAHDVNNDSFDDLVVGIPGYDKGTGAAVVYSGHDGSVLYRFEGEQEGEHYGESVGGAGDADSDGFFDIIVGAPHFDDRKKEDAGRFEVYSGRKGKKLFDAKGKTAMDLMGWSVASAGDFNDDSFADVIVGAPGAGLKKGSRPGVAYVYHGKKGKLLSSFEGDADGDGFGWSVHAAGDTDSDAAGDVIIGTWTSVGYARLISGRKGEVRETFTGTREGEYFGATVGGGLRFSVPDEEEVGNPPGFIFDYNADGFDDILVGAPGDPAAVDRPDRPLPTVRVFSGKTLKLLASISAESNQDHLGGALGAASDVNSDGSGDLVIGDDQHGLEAGRARVFLGVSGAQGD